MKNISNIKGMSSKHSFLEDPFLAIQVKIGRVVDCAEIQIQVLIPWLKNVKLLETQLAPKEKNEKPDIQKVSFHSSHTSLHWKVVKNQNV